MASDENFYNDIHSVSESDSDSDNKDELFFNNIFKKIYKNYFKQIQCIDNKELKSKIME